MTATIHNLADYRRRPFLELDLEPEIGPGDLSDEQMRKLIAFVDEWHELPDFTSELVYFFDQIDKQ